MTLKKDEQQEHATAPVGAEEESAALWNELEQAERGEAASDAGDETQGQQANAQDTDAEDAADDSEGWAGNDQTADQDATEAPQQEDPAQGQEQPAAQQPPANDPFAGDPVWSSATAEQKQVLSQWQHEIRSNRGRIATLQRKLQELQQAASQQQRQQQNGGAQQQGGAEASEALMGSEKWKAFREDYPEMAEPLEHVIGAIVQENARLKQQVGGIVTERQQQAQMAEFERLSQAHPDWQQIAQDQAYREWLSQQPPGVQALHESDFAEDAITLLNIYKGQTGAAQAHPQQAPAASYGAGNSATRSTLPARRQRQLQSAAAARSSGPGAASGIPDDEEGAWRAFERMGL